MTSTGKKLLIRPPEHPLANLSVANQEDLGEGNDEFYIQNIYFILLEFSTRHKTLRLETSGFNSPPKEGVLRIFIALKNTSPWPATKRLRMLLA
jgi:hypothetical protein